MFGKSKKLRFSFGRNWINYSKYINNDKIKLAIKTINKNTKFLKNSNNNFLDVGCGSGLFSLAAKKLKMNVLSIDIDPFSIDCTTKLKKKFFNKDKNWKIKKISLTDHKFKKKIIKKYEYIYCWGVAHHTGNMFLAIENLIKVCKKDSIIVLAIYNEQFIKSKIWLIIKYIFNLNVFFKYIIILIFFPYFVILRSIIQKIKNKKDNRGMMNWYDMIDWLGGYPYEYAKPKKIINLFEKKGFKIVREELCGDNLGCNEFVFQKK